MQLPSTGLTYCRYNINIYILLIYIYKVKQSQEKYFFPVTHRGEDYIHLPQVKVKSWGWRWLVLWILWAQG